MFAIVEIAGLQYKVEQDQKLFVNRLAGDKGSKISFDKVVQTMKETGHDLSSSYKETSEAGLAKINL